MAIKTKKGLYKGIDGILGLGAGDESGHSYLNALKDNNLIDDPIVSFNLKYYISGVSNGESSMMFGGYDETNFDGNLHWFPLKTNSWWAIDLR